MPRPARLLRTIFIHLSLLTVFAVSSGCLLLGPKDWVVLEARDIYRDVYDIQEEDLPDATREAIRDVYPQAAFETIQSLANAYDEDARDVHNIRLVFRNDENLFIQAWGDGQICEYDRARRRWVPLGESRRPICENSQDSVPSL